MKLQLSDKLKRDMLSGKIKKYAEVKDSSFIVPFNIIEISKKSVRFILTRKFKSDLLIGSLSLTEVKWNPEEGEVLTIIYETNLGLEVLIK